MISMTGRLNERFDEPGLPSDITPTVFVVHHDSSVCQLLTWLADDAGWRSRTFHSPLDFLAEPRTFVPSCLVLDVSLPLLSGLDLQGQIVRERRDMPVIFITDDSDVRTTVCAMKAGAIEFFTKPLEPDRIKNAIHRAVEHSRAALKDECELELLKDLYAGLSVREKEVMGFVVSGLLNKQVAGELGISEITVKAHRGKMMRKMEASCLPDLVRMYARLEINPATRRLC